MLEEEVWCGVSKSEPEMGAVPGQERAPSPGREGSGPRRAAGGTWQRAERRIVRLRASPAPSHAVPTAFRAVWQHSRLQR